MGTRVGTEETPAFLRSTNAAKIMMSLKKSLTEGKGQGARPLQS